jgi:hypothetical protein
LVCARVDTSLRRPLPMTAVSNYALVKPKKCHCSNESCGGIRTPLSPTRAWALREHWGARYGHQGAHEMSSHLEQISDGFSSCESRNFPPSLGVLARSLDPCRSRVGPHDVAMDICALRTPSRLFRFEMDDFASSHFSRETGAPECSRRETAGCPRSLCVHKGAQCCAAVTIFRRAIHPFVDC